MIPLIASSVGGIALQVGIPAFLERLIVRIVTFIPRLVGALLILLVGWIIGRALAGLTRNLSDRIGLDQLVLDTPLGRAMGGSRQAVSKTFGLIVAWFVYALAILGAANVLAIGILSEWIATAVSYLPAFIAGLLVIVLGFIVADFIGDMITRTRGATQTRYTSWFATGVRVFLYFTAVVIGLDTMGIDVSILYVFARALSWGIAAAIALGIGIALGWGGRDYVAHNVDRWMSSARESAPSPQSDDD